MPVHTGKDNKGCFAQWGGQKKYYYECNDSAARDRAKAKAVKQGAVAHAGGYKSNERFEMRLQKITANKAGPSRIDNMAGREYRVVPMIMLTEGVHTGIDNRALYYSKEELAKVPQIWNTKPVIVYHPAGEDGACDPVILNNRQVGLIMNTKIADIKVNNKTISALKSEAWLDEERMNKVDERIAVAIEKNEMMELSTGLFADNEIGEGDWNGEKYEATIRNIRPDHLALLPDLKGACSIEDGAGFLRLNAKPDKIHIINNAMSHGNIRSLLNSWLQEKVGEFTYAEDVYDSFFVYLDKGKYWKYNYSISNNIIEITGEPEEIVRVTEYRTKDGVFIGNENDIKNRKESKMDKEKIVAALIKSNSNSWGEADKETLLAMDEAVLQKLQEGDNAATSAVENAVKKAEADFKANAEKEKKDAEAKLTTNQKGDDKPPVTVEGYIAAAPEEFRPVLNGMHASYKAMHKSLVKKIMANEQNQFTEADLSNKELPELRKIVSLFSTKTDEDEIAMNFGGQGDPVPLDVISNERPLIAPKVLTASVK